MTPVEKLQEFCRENELILDIKTGRYGVALDGQDGSTVWLWPDATISIESATPGTMVSVASSVRDLGLLERATYEALEKHRDRLREAAEPATEAAQ